MSSVHFYLSVTAYQFTHWCVSIGALKGVQFVGVVGALISFVSVAVAAFVAAIFCSVSFLFASVVVFVSFVFL